MALRHWTSGNGGEWSLRDGQQKEGSYSCPGFLPREGCLVAVQQGAVGTDQRLPELRWS